LITDAEGVQFLQWCLRRLNLHWSGFRKVRRRVYQRINRRLQEVALSNLAAYRTYLEDHPDERATLDSLCWISEEVIESVDVSLNSEIASLAALSEAAQRRGRRHDVIIVVDLGDLREGLWPRDLTSFMHEALGVSR
jgi:chemotaxis protein methyltransferase CheR